jgi:hypothetical protein
MKYSEYPVEYLDIFDKFNSSYAFEEEAGISGFGLARLKPEGSGITYDSASQAFIARYVHAVYALGFMISKEMYDDGLGEVTALRRAQALAFSIRQTKEILGANVLNRAFNSSYTMGANHDGVELCSLLHPNKAGGTGANELAVAADLSEAALEQACLDISAMKNDRGMTIAIKPTGLIIPAALEFEAARILKSLGQPGAANNDINAMRVLGKFPKGAAVNHYLTDDDAWFVKTDCPDGMKYFERQGDSFGMDNDFDTGNGKFKAEFRGQFGWTDYRSIFGSPGA